MTEMLDNRIDGIVTFPDLIGIVGVNLTGMPFRSVDGGDVTIAASVKDRDVGEIFDHEIENLPTVGDFTLSRTWVEERDAPVYDALLSRVGLVRATVSRARRDTLLNRIGMSTNTRCLLKGCTHPPGDSASDGAKSMLVLTFSGGIPS